MCAEHKVQNTVGVLLRKALILCGYVLAVHQAGRLLRAEMGLVHPSTLHSAWQEPGRQLLVD